MKSKGAELATLDLYNSLTFNMVSDIVIIGGGAAGLMAAFAAAEATIKGADSAQVRTVTVLEKMPRPGRKIMITGKGRCNFANVKEWNEFSAHIRSKANVVKAAFYNFTPEDSLAFFESFGMPTVVERGDRAFPASHHSRDVIDTLVNACNSVGVKIETNAEVASVSHRENGFEVVLSDGRKYRCSKLIIATGGLSYPSTGSTGDGYDFAKATGHTITPLFPSLTALVPKGYKDSSASGHIDRTMPLSELGEKLCGIQLKNVGATLMIEGNEAQSEFGDIDFTDGGIEGPIGFQLSRKAVKAMVNGSKVAIILDLKPGVEPAELSARVKALWNEVEKDPRSRNLKDKEKCRILLGKLMPWDLIPGFTAMHPDILKKEGKKVFVNLAAIAKYLKDWHFDIDGYVGYERAVVTAGGVSTDDIIPKTLESRKVPGLYFCGEVLDIDADTGGYNLHLAFATGRLAGQSAAK